jgi:hypothetical protein
MNIIDRINQEIIKADYYGIKLKCVFVSKEVYRDIISSINYYYDLKEPFKIRDLPLYISYDLKEDFVLGFTEYPQIPLTQEFELRYEQEAKNRT